MTWPAPPQAPQVRATEKKPCWIADLPASLALGAGRGSAAGGAAAAVAGVAGLQAANLHLGLGAEDGVLEVDGQVEAQVVAALLPAGAARAAAHGEHLAEQVAEDVADVHAAGKGRAAEALARPLTPAWP